MDAIKKESSPKSLNYYEYTNKKSGRVEIVKADKYEVDNRSNVDCINFFEGDNLVGTVRPASEIKIVERKKCEKCGQMLA